jgi:hypothetical protein
LEGASGAAVLAARLGDVPAELVSTVRPMLQAIGWSTARAARGNASWSTRIPRAIGVRTSLSGRRLGVFVTVSGARAPHARAYEGITARRDSFSHPLFGDRDVWVEQPTRPFLAPAAEANREAATAAAERAITAALRGAGL